MESASVFEQTTAIHELNQGIKMAEQLRVNLTSPESREILIKKILSSYEKALFALRSGGQPRSTHQTESSLPNSSTSSPQNSEIEFEFPSRKRKASPPPPPPSPVFEITYKRIHTCNNVAQSAPPPSPEKDKTRPTNDHELSSTNPGEILSNIRANLSVNTSGLNAIIPSSFSFPSTPFGFSGDDFESLDFPNYLDDDVFRGYSGPYISPATSDWGSSSTLDFATQPVDLYPDFEFSNLFLMIDNPQELDTE
ncbi:hypothetical protein LXL04_005772 [Taraxacum kok-saghyz]